VAMIASSAVRTLIAPAHSIVILAACAIVFAFIYIVGSLLFGALTPEDQDAINKQARRLSRKFTWAEVSKRARVEDRGSRIEDRPIASSTIIDPPSSILDPPLFTPQFKARAVLRVLQDPGSSAGICGELQIDESLLSDWMEMFTKQASSVFEKEQAAADADERVAELERLVGRLRRELESERIAELERLVGRLVLELEESKREPAILGAPVRSNGKHEWDL
jgi:transposase-like protein